MKINDVNRGIQKNRKRMRVGRGPGSGKGRTAGRGNKGQGQLAGWSSPAIFEGGRMPIIRQIPKRGFHNRHGSIVVGVNVDDLEACFAAGACIGNDISAFADPRYLEVAARYGASVVCTHIRLAPRVPDPEPVYGA